MDINYQENSINNQQLKEQTTSEISQKDINDDNTDSFPLEKLQEVEAQLSHIISTGIQDTSFMSSSESCVLIWEHTNKLFPEPQNDDFGVDVRLKNVIRALGEGSVLPLSDLVPALRLCIQQFCKFETNFDDKLFKLVPIFLSRRNLGEPYINLSGVVRSECKRKECMWVWESPTTEMFPPQLLDQVKSFRDARNITSRRYKALSKLKNCIITEHLPGQQQALEVLSTLDRKILQDRERKEKLDLKRKFNDYKKKNEKIKVQKTNSNMLLSWLKPQKTEEVVEAPKEPLSPKPLTEDSSGNIFIEGTNKQKLDLENILINLNCFNKSVFTSSMSQFNSFLENKGEESTNSSVNNHELSSSKSEFDTLNKVSGKFDQNGTDTEGIEFNTNKELLLNSSRSDQVDPALVKNEKDKMDIFELSSLHRDVWTRFHMYLTKNREFYVETTENQQMVPEPLNNVEASNHNSSELKPSRHCRIFSMFDNGWKRPPMRYLVGRRSDIVTSFNQVSLDSNVDYYVDSDEDWFERYDADDVEVSEEEEDEEEEEEQEWIVQDSPQLREFSTGVFDNESSVKVFCIYKNWHWIIDGKPVTEEFSNKELAQSNGIILTHSEYGFGFEGYTKNPIIDLMSKLRGTKITMSRKDVEELLKLCHGKHTRKEELIAEFKESKPFAATSEIKNKFKKYLTRLKIDDKPHRWMVTPEAAKLFNLRRELDKILTNQLNTEILSEPIF